MKISLIINTYNRTDFLEKSLTSIVAQSVLPDELIIADDGSSEDLVGVIKKYKKKINIPIKFVTQADSGFRLARCRNNGVREASGEFLIFIDQDLIFTKDFLKTFRENRKENHFTVGWPIRSTEEQLKKLAFDNIENCNFAHIFTNQQVAKVKKQFRKDRTYRILNNMKLRKHGTKFRGGVVGIFKDDYIKINGYDENYIGWGNEDDDFGRRLYYSGVKGLNPFRKDFSIHLWHPLNHDNGERVNSTYHKEKAAKLNKNNYYCKFGYKNTLGKDKYSVVEI